MLVDGHEMFKEYRPQFDYITRDVNIDVGTHKIAWIFTQDMETTYVFFTVHSLQNQNLKK